MSLEFLAQTQRFCLCSAVGGGVVGGVSAEIGLRENLLSRACSHSKVGEFPRNCGDAMLALHPQQPSITEARTVPRPPPRPRSRPSSKYSFSGTIPTREARQLDGDYSSSIGLILGCRVVQCSY